MRKLVTTIAVLLVLGSGLRAKEGAGRYHVNERWGYKVRFPSGWITAALSADEEWIASKHLSKKVLRAKTTKTDIWQFENRPEMWVIGFPHARKGVTNIAAGVSIASFSSTPKHIDLGAELIRKLCVAQRCLTSTSPAARAISATPETSNATPQSWAARPSR